MSTHNILKLVASEDAEARRSLFANAGLSNSFERPPKAVLDDAQPGSVFLAVFAQFFKLSRAQPSIEARIQVLEQGLQLVKCLSLFLLQTKHQGSLAGLHTELMQIWQQSSANIQFREAFPRIYHEVAGIHCQLASQLAKPKPTYSSTAKSTPFKPIPRPRTQPITKSSDACGQFNAGACTYGPDCKFQHICQICHGAHARITCPKFKKLPQNNTNKPA